MTGAQPPPDPPAQPEAAQPAPRWPAWYGPVAFVGAFVLIALFVGVLSAIAAAAGADVEDPGSGFTLLATFVQDGILVAVAVGLAAIRLRPRAWHFGLRRVGFWSAAGWTALAVVSFYVFAASYTALVQPEGEQRVVEDLGAEESTALLIGAAVLVVGLAPVAEELFFRAFFYGALRTRLPVLVAATLDGLLFGAIHYTGPDTLSILPPLAFLGFAFCMLYERTGSLYPVIAFHSLNNAIALSVAVGGDNATAPLIVGAVTIVACGVVPGRQRREAPSPLPARRGLAARP